jgi:formyl-CoA transferase
VLTVQNLAPGAACAFSSFEALRRRARRICDIWGWARTVTRGLRPADPERSGFLIGLGTPGRPTKPQQSVADIAAGMYAYTGILSALL